MLLVSGRGVVCGCACGVLLKLWGLWVGVGCAIHLVD